MTLQQRLKVYQKSMDWMIQHPNAGKGLCNIFSNILNGNITPFLNEFQIFCPTADEDIPDWPFWWERHSKKGKMERLIALSFCIAMVKYEIKHKK